MFALLGSFDPRGLESNRSVGDDVDDEGFSGPNHFKINLGKIDSDLMCIPQSKIHFVTSWISVPTCLVERPRASR